MDFEVASFWSGSDLLYFEHLCMKSFVENVYIFHLFTKVPRRQHTWLFRTPRCGRNQQWTTFFALLAFWVRFEPRIPKPRLWFWVWGEPRALYPPVWINKTTPARRLSRNSAPRIIYAKNLWSPQYFAWNCPHSQLSGGPAVDEWNENSCLILKQLRLIFILFRWDRLNRGWAAF